MIDCRNLCKTDADARKLAGQRSRLTKPHSTDLSSAGQGSFDDLDNFLVDDRRFMYAAGSQPCFAPHISKFIAIFEKVFH